MTETTQLSPELEARADAQDIKPPVDQLMMLKEKAKMMGLSHSPNIGVDALRAKINERLEGEANTTLTDQDSDDEQNQDEKQEEIPEVVAELTPRQKKNQFRKESLAENMKLIRVRITNMDPKKANLPGEILTVANEVIGTVRRFVPYGEKTDEGWHVENCLYKMMKNRKFLQIQTLKNKRTGTNEIIKRMVREFALEILPPLTEKQLRDLAMQQAAADGAG
jgi:hypothetical protein